VVPNKFPALAIGGDIELRSEGLYELMNGLGTHEVIIETPDHETHMATLSENQFGDILRVYRERMVELGKDGRFRYILIYKNQGVEAGETIEHTHSQVIALPMVPSHVAEELLGIEKYYKHTQGCIYCDIMGQEIKGKTRLVSENENFVVFCPFASRLPFETWILPKKHSPCFEYASEPENAELSRTLRETLMRLNRSLNNPPFNYIIHSRPLDERGPNPYHWHIEIMPKLTQVAGFEWGTGFYINPVAPEDSALALRKAPV
jgi:UDPglucose--hexose-1-phosphate uridylyltransferase